jgi:hypothetical protein
MNDEIDEDIRVNRAFKKTKDHMCKMNAEI